MRLVSPNIVSCKDWNGDVFAELDASFSNKNLQYHVIGKFTFPQEDLATIRNLALTAKKEEDKKGIVIPFRIITR